MTTLGSILVVRYIPTGGIQLSNDESAADKMKGAIGPLLDDGRCIRVLELADQIADLAVRRHKTHHRFSRPDKQPQLWSSE